MRSDLIQPLGPDAIDRAQLLKIPDRTHGDHLSGAFRSQIGEGLQLLQGGGIQVHWSIWMV